MKAIQVSQYVQGPEDLVVSTVADPRPAPDQYLIAVHAAAANFFDTLQIQGKYQNQPPFPWVAGAEFAGVVLATPQGTGGPDAVQRPPRYAVGDRVFGSAQGAYATKVCATEDVLCPMPPGWSFVEAAGLYVTVTTSYTALVLRAGIKPGDWVLVHAAAGGVGLAALQIAKAFGATVVATVGTAHKKKVAQAYGADHVIDYKADPDWPETVRRLTPDGRGVDIVYDPVGLVDRSTKCTAWNGRILVVGFASGTIEKVAMNKVLLKNISLVGIHWGAYTKNEPTAIPVVWEGLSRLMAQGALRPTVFSAPGADFVGLGRVPAALKALGGRESWGKVVVEVPPEETSKL